MKKLLSFLACFIAAVGASSQDWEVVTHEGQAQDKTIILADLVVQNGSPVYEGNYEIAVFVGDECRMIVSDDDEAVLQTVNETKFLQFIVPGTYGNESDERKTITFELCDANGAVYDITPSSPTITFRDGDTYGGTGSSGRVQLAVTLPSSISLKPFEVEVGKSINLLGQIEIVPADAQLPQNYIWSVNDEEYATIEGDVLTAIRVPSVDEEEPVLYLEFGEEEYETPFTIILHATAINIVTDEFEVIIDDGEELTAFVANLHNSIAYSLVPPEANDEVLWEMEDGTYFETSDDIWIPVKGGTTHIRPYIKKKDGTYLYPASPEWITVNIIVPVEEAYFDWPIDPQTQNMVTFKCNVGDENILQHLAQYIKILPLDATDRSYTITDNVELYGSPNEPGYNPVLTVYDDNTIIALAPGYAELLIEPNGFGGEDLAFTVLVQVFNPAKTISAVENPLIIDSKTSRADAGDAIAANISYGPEDSMPRGTVTTQTGGVFTGEGGLSDNGVFFTITSPTDKLASGETTVNATLRWNDYSNYDGTDETIAEKTASVDFVVNITDAVDHFEISITPNANDPTTGTITLTPVPATATFSWDDFTLVTYNGSYGEWDVLEVSKTANGTYSYSASLPGNWEVYVLSNGEEMLGDEPETLTAPAKVSLQSGWQWKSNNWGTMISVVTLNAFFGDELVEARTYDELLYNDSEWGYWGSMIGQTGIQQSMMYKVKMSAAKESYLDNGHIVESPYLSLSPGWNWVGSPYFYDRTIEHVFETMDIDDGFVIVSKTEGSAELSDGEWTGNLKLIRKGQGYYIFNPTEETVWGNLPMEVYDGMEQGDETSAGARAKSRSVWHYDHSQFAGNMTMVVSFSDLDNPEEYTIGAFVDGECRGEGSFDHGLAFITVHTDGGEEVSFRLHNELTDEYFDIDQTVVSRMRIGSVKAPMQLTSNSVVTGIATVGRSASNVENYDLNGRAVDGNAKGITIRKMQDGTVKKVVRK